jgi:glycosyltransferase involved in cell wall biosynthesis
LEAVYFAKEIFYDGFISSHAGKQQFLGHARALIVPSTYEEPFGLVMVESLACGTPVIGLRNGAIGEVVQDGTTGVVSWAVKPIGQSELTRSSVDEPGTIANLASALGRIASISRQACRDDFEQRFTTRHMCSEYLAAYQSLVDDLP